MSDTMTPQWPDQLLARLGDEIAAARSARDMSAVKLSEAMVALGVPLHRVAITRIEKGEQAVTVPELVALGAALDTDWSRWLITASDGLTIKGERDDRAYYRKLLAEVDHEIETVQHNKFQAEEAPKHFRLEDALREKMTADANRYRALLEGLQTRRSLILDALGGRSDA